MSMFRKYPVFTMVIGGILLFFFGFRLEPFIAHKEECDEGIEFINRDVICGEPDVIKKTGYIETRNDIIALIESEKQTGAIADAAVYFRDLKRGPVFGVDELTVFAPASLLKLPLAFVYLSAAEDQPGVMSQKIDYVGTTTVSEQRVIPRESARTGEEYTVESLLRMMLSYSDNASYEVLEQFLQNSPGRTIIREEVFQEIGLIDPKDRIEATVTVRGYASLFRILYNASYLNVENSEKVLEWLANSEYREGLVAGVPEGVKVSHKFGERLYANNVKELHDCGIIYFPQNPYLLCVMTRGMEWESLEKLTAEISRIVYTEVDSRRVE